MSSVLRITWFDVKVLFKTPVWVLLNWGVFGLQLAIYGTLIAKLVVAVDEYFTFYAVGFIVIIVFEAASHIGRRFVEHAHEGRLPYLLSLPISRPKLFFATALQGGTEMALNISVPLAVTLAVIGQLSAVSVLAAVGALFWMGFGVAGLMLALSFIAFRSIDIYTAIIAGLSALIIRFSTVFYPLIFLPPGYQGAAYASPLTYGADLIRAFLGFDPSILLDARIAVAVLAALAVSTLSLGLVLLERLVEGVKAA